MDNKVILYTLNCPKCKVLELKLKQKNIAFEVISEEEKVIETGKEHGINGAPILQVGTEFLDFTNAVKYINEVK